MCESNGLEVPKFTQKELECIELYKQLTTTISSALLKSTRIAIKGKVQEFLENIDMNATDSKGTLFPVPSVTSLLNKCHLLQINNE